MIARLRTGVLPFFIVAALAVFFGTRHFFGNPAAALSTALFTLVPSVLAHAGLATTDIAVTAMLGAAFFLLAWWSEAPSWRRAAALGAALGLAVFAKFSAIPYFAAAATLALAFHILIARPGRAELLRLARERASAVLVAGAVAALVLWAGCRFSFGSVEGWKSGIQVPAPELFAAFRELVAHTRRGHQTYLLGESGTTGWWNYYLVVLAVKTPIALLLASAAGAFACWERRRRGGLIPLALCVGVLLAAMQSSINIGVRHILPIFVGLSVVGGLGLVRLARISWPLPGALIVWMTVSGALAHPDYLSYFNEFAGSRPENILVDSDLDWDQSWLRAAQILRARQATEVTLEFDRSKDFAPGEILAHVYGLPPVLPPMALPRPGWHVVDVGILRQILAGRRIRSAGRNVVDDLVALKGPWYARLIPVERVGGLAICFMPPMR